MSMQLLGVNFAAAESCQSALALLQVGILGPLWAVPWSTVGLRLTPCPAFGLWLHARPGAGPLRCLPGPV